MHHAPSRMKSSVIAAAGMATPLTWINFELSTWILDLVRHITSWSLVIWFRCAAHSGVLDMMPPEFIKGK